MRIWGLQVTHCSGCWGMCGCHPALGCGCPPSCGSWLFLGLGNSPFIPWECGLHPLFLLSSASPSHDVWSQSRLLPRALCNVVFWAGKYDVMYEIWSRHSSLLKYIYILYIYTGVGTENILRKVWIPACFEMYSGIILGQVTKIHNLMESPEVKWYERLVGSFWSHIFLTG